jgi:hypothetical protein
VNGLTLACLLSVSFLLHGTTEPVELDEFVQELHDLPPAIDPGPLAFSARTFDFLRLCLFESHAVEPTRRTF